ncbi:MAG: hypothetical protein ACR2NP_02550 [Pirellulaceae bacterium]
MTVDIQRQREESIAISSKQSADYALEALLEADLPPDEMRKSMIKTITDFERNFRKRFPLLWGATLIGPAVLTAVILVLIGLTTGWGLAWKFVMASVATFFVFGRFVILGGQEGQVEGLWEYVALSPGQLFWMVTYMDMMVALFVTFHMGILFRLPWVGEKIAGLASDGKFIMEMQPWLKRLAFVALVGFVIFPTSTTGSIGGSIFGRLLGLGRVRTVLGVIIGSILGNSIMLFFAKEINDFVGPNSTWIKLAGIPILIAGVMFIEWKYRQAKNRYLEAQESRHARRQAEEAEKKTS